MSSLHISDIPVGASVKVRVPATSANLGPGYDSMGLGLGFYDELVVERIESGLEFELSGEGSADVPHDESHLVLQAMKAGFAAAGLGEMPPVTGPPPCSGGADLPPLSRTSRRAHRPLCHQSRRPGKRSYENSGVTSPPHPHHTPDNSPPTTPHSTDFTSGHRTRCRATCTGSYLDPQRNIDLRVGLRYSLLSRFIPDLRPSLT